MDVAKKVADILTRVTKLFYLKYEGGEHPSIALAYGDEERLYFERFADDAECKAVWGELTRMLTTFCRPPFILAKDVVLFQPAHLERLFCFEDERGYFVVLMFAREHKHNCAFIYTHMQQRDKEYQELLKVLGETIEDKDLSPPLH